MTKRPSLASAMPITSRIQPKAGQVSDSEAAAPATTAANKATRDYKTVMMRINRAGWAELSHLSIETDRNLEDMMIEAANDFLAKNNRPPIIEKRAVPKDDD